MLYSNCAQIGLCRLYFSQISKAPNTESASQLLTPPIKSQSLLNYFVERSANLLQRCVFIVKVRIDDVHVLKLHPLDWCLQSLFDVLLVEGPCWIQLCISSILDFCSNYDGLPFHFQIFKDLAKSLLTFPLFVYFSSVKMIDAELETSLNHFLVLFVGFSSRINDFAKTDFGHLEAWVS